MKGQDLHPIVDETSFSYRATLAGGSSSLISTSPYVNLEHTDDSDANVIENDRVDYVGQEVFNRPVRSTLRDT